MSQKKILYFVSEDKYFLTHKLSHALVALENGFSVLIVCKVTDFKKKILSYGFQVKNINLDRGSLNIVKELKTLYELFKILKAFQPDIIVNIALKPILYGLLCSKLFKKINLKINAIVGLGYLFINKGPKITILKVILKKVLFFLFKDTKVIVVFQNRDDRNYFLQKKIITSCKQKIIAGSGVDVKYFKPSNIKKKYDLVMHSRMLRDKGVIDLIKAVKELQKRNIFLKVLLLGNPDYKNLASIKKNELEQWNSEKIIKWIPEKQNILTYIQQSKVAILPSYREGFPKSLLEAASCGLPLITNNVPGCKEICIHNYNGFLVAPKDYMSLSKKIELLIFNEDLIKQMGKNSRKLVIKKYSQNLISKQFLNLYNEIK